MRQRMAADKLDTSSNFILSSTALNPEKIHTSVAINEIYEEKLFQKSAFFLQILVLWIFSEKYPNLGYGLPCNI